MPISAESLWLRDGEKEEGVDRDMARDRVREGE